MKNTINKPHLKVEKINILIIVMNYINKTNIYLLLIGPVVIGLLFVSIVPNFLIWWTHERLSDKSLSIIGSISFFFMGFSGFFQIIRKETPGIFSKHMKGIPSVINGIGIMVLFWLLSLILVILYFN